MPLRAGNFPASPLSPPDCPWGSPRMTTAPCLEPAASNEPERAPGKILSNTNPRNGQEYFNTSLFSAELLGFVGDSGRNFFHGPGINNFDLALLKNFNITESKILEYRCEFFNAFNHAQFNNPNGNFTAGPGAFGYVTSARDPRIVQMALKFIF